MDKIIGAKRLGEQNDKWVETTRWGNDQGTGDILLYANSPYVNSDYN